MATTPIPFVPAMPLFDAAGNLTLTWRLFLAKAAGTASPSFVSHAVTLDFGAADVTSPLIPDPGVLLAVLVKQDFAGGIQPVWDPAYAGQPAALRIVLAKTFSSFLFVGDTDFSGNPVWRHLAVLNEGVPLT